MIEKSIENFIINACYWDVVDYKINGRPPVVEKYEKNQWSYIIEIMIITIKSLRPSQKDNGNVIDYKRFKSELDLWKSYRHGMNKSLLCSVDGGVHKNYFGDMDVSIYARVSVITLANQDWETIKRELIKNILFSSGNIEVTLECLMLSKLLFLMLKDKTCEYERLVNGLKNEIINFTQEELSNYDEYYKSPKADYGKNYKIDFERMRINLISLLNEVDIANNFLVLKTCLKIIKNEKDHDDREEEQFKESGNFFISGFVGVIEGQVISKEIKDIGFIKNLCNYLGRLRKGRIDLKDLKIRNYELPHIFDYKEGQVFSHPLLSTSQIIYRGERESFEMAYVKTQTGIYRFVNLERN